VTHWSHARILLAEDDCEFRSLVAGALRNAGFHVTEASDGCALLERLAEAVRPDATIDRFDMIVSDIRMPHFTALDVLVGAHASIATIPVVLITAFGSPDLHQRALRLGATAVLDKPFRLDDLCSTITTILSRQSADRSETAPPRTTDSRKSS
jgi:CheY-like chemotaxis protein